MTGCFWGWVARRTYHPCRMPVKDTAAGADRARPGDQGRPGPPHCASDFTFTPIYATVVYYSRQCALGLDFGERDLNSMKSCFQAIAIDGVWIL
uniref:Uncharacterized protein n=1 Tax=Setaria italica TaxID=4555 RepID=K3ZKI6_SETIT